jgi:hypothetical protein
VIVTTDVSGGNVWGFRCTGLKEIDERVKGNDSGFQNQFVRGGIVVVAGVMRTGMKNIL